MTREHGRGTEKEKTPPRCDGGAEAAFLAGGGVRVLPWPARGARGAFRAALKRGSDVLLSLLLLVLLFLPMLLIAVWVRCDSAGPAIFRQRRVGRDLVPFTVYKFRTMSCAAPHERPSASLSGEERARYLTRAGRILRRTALDELPQLWNVLRGDMSLVGPRPVILAETRLTALRAALGASAVRPGITGLAQISGRDECGAEEKAYLDALYARTQSAVGDLVILLRTARTVFSGVGGN